MPKIVLIFPKVSELSSDNRINIFPPLGVLSLAGSLISKGIEVSVVDERIEDKFEEKLLHELKSGVLFVGISSMSGEQIKHGLAISDFIKKNSKIPVVWGGVHPTLEPVSTLKHSLVDMVAVGESEETVLGLVEYFQNGTAVSRIKGIGFKKEGRPVFNDAAGAVDLDSIPFIPFNLVNLRSYITDTSFFGFRGRLIIPLETSRGCSHRCTFCRESVQPRPWRAMGAQRVVEQIKEVTVRYNSNTFVFCDDNFFVDIKRAEAIMNLLEEQGTDIEWYTNIRPDYLTRRGEGLVSFLQSRGCKSLTMGIESGSNKVLEKIGKGITTEDVFKVNRIMSKSRIKPLYVAILGFPYDNKHTINETYAMAVRLAFENPGAKIDLVKLIPTPATKILDECCRRGFKRPESLVEWSEVFDKMMSRYAYWLEDDAMRWLTKCRYIMLVLWLKDAKPLFAGRFIFYLFGGLFLLRQKYQYWGLWFEPKVIMILRKIKRGLAVRD
ncbi:MAG: radical SAM protein [Candidatus Omnitrophica bacterium]|nr:radical SAM protein [Candidatus Omnitrophota bacterium]MBD3269108.1 radical SAM protein [Candidatus Omnitrophota bacterium]